MVTKLVVQTADWKVVMMEKMMVVQSVVSQVVLMEKQTVDW